MINSKNLPTETVSLNSKSPLRVENTYSFFTKHIKKILIALAVIVFQYPLVFSSSPGKDSSPHSEVYLSPGRGNEQAASDLEPHHPPISAAASNQMNTQRLNEGWMANPASVNGTDEDLTKKTSPEILDSEPEKAETGPAQSKTSELKSHSKAPKINLKALKAVKKGVPHDGDALSILWVVIVVILLFYLIALLAGGLGLGGLIHLLLIVILVLVILWLLRVI